MGEARQHVARHEVALGRSRRPSSSRLDPRAKLLGAHHGSTFFERLAFRDAIRSGGKPIVSVADGALAVGVAGERSAREKRPIELRELGI